MRPSQDPSGGQSHTPIYDALYSEYRRSFRALPGDRSGEENLGFMAFGTGLFGSRLPLGGHSGHSAGFSTGLAVTGGATGHGSGSGTGTGTGTGTHSGGLGSWQRVGRHSGRTQPAALPPGSRGA
ncbi:hypothetical protein [Streptomyces sp. NBC_01363]|uniref:hypothetical protein n=1 Tax=Streptomyces sp. NBC_01363 TaxID=2903840 RepID=UPI00225AA720|nr:hypothetical protein [Streptomyces sp. NBC_01363]MCX4732976.1 hypothetical protein [Streptomyces sp. NBC_01363]